jgi:hypothetical protein
MPLDGGNPMPSGRIDVTLLIAGAQPMECPSCYTERLGRHMVKHVTDRAGVEIRHCQCPACDHRWQRQDHAI